MKVKSNPLENAYTAFSGKGLKDPRWPASKGWIKMGKVVNDVDIHFNYNVNTGHFADFKVKIGYKIKGSKSGKGGTK